MTLRGTRAWFPGLAVAAILVGGIARPLPVDAQETHVLIVAGLGGEDEYKRAFVQWGTILSDAALAAGVESDHVTFLAEDPTMLPARIRARSTAEEIRRAFAALGAAAAPEDRVLVVLIGHGEGSRADSRVSLPGADLTVADYEVLLDELVPRTVAVVNLASASGDFVSELASHERIVVTATRSAGQRNAPRFGEYFVQAFGGSGSDLDRDGRVSLLEAFEYARQETERYYRDRGLLVPETALLEDRPGGTGVHLPIEDEAVGLVAGRFFLEGVGPRIELADPSAAAQLRALYARQEAIEVRINDLRARRPDVEPAAYEAQLQPLLIELAEVGAEIRALEGTGG